MADSDFSATTTWGAVGGVLSFAQRWQLVLQALRARFKARSRPHAVNSAGNSVLTELDARALDSIAAPDDRVAQAAYRFAHHAQPPWLTQHALRAYAWGSLLALNAGLQYERSSLFAACLLHDIGLTPQAAEPAGQCFAVRGARIAHTALLEAGADRAVAQRVAAAIGLHLNIEVPVEQGAEAHLLRAGSGLDVMGQRAREIPRRVQQAVLIRHPRMDFKRQLCTCLQHEAQTAPNTRIGVYVRRLSFLNLIRNAPFAE